MRDSLRHKVSIFTWGCGQEGVRYSNICVQFHIDWDVHRSVLGFECARSFEHLDFFLCVGFDVRHVSVANPERFGSFFLVLPLRQSQQRPRTEPGTRFHEWCGFLSPQGIVIGTGENSEFGEVFKMMQAEEVRRPEPSSFQCRFMCSSI